LLFAGFNATLIDRKQNKILMQAQWHVNLVSVLSGGWLFEEPGGTNAGNAMDAAPRSSLTAHPGAIPGGRQQMIPCFLSAPPKISISVYTGSVIQRLRENQSPQGWPGLYLSGYAAVFGSCVNIVASRRGLPPGGHCVN